MASRICDKCGKWFHGNGPMFICPHCANKQEIKPMPKIRCGVCGTLQGSQICKSCSRKISGFLAKGVSPEAIPDLMFSTIQTTLDFGGSS